MLPKKNRLNLTKGRFKKGDVQVSDRLFKVVVKKGREQGPKIGFIVNSKVGNAVTRNRVRRRLSDYLEKNIEKLPVDYHLIFIAYPQSSQASAAELYDSVGKALIKI
jgi:ribonuclease P protein component